MSEADDATLPDTRPGGGAATTTGDLGTRYQLGDTIGRGGMGEVRLARDARIDRDVAVKLMRSSVRDEAALARFFREARVQGGLEHPSVVPVHDLGIDSEGNPYFVMKRLAGTTLADVLASQDPAVAARWPRRQLLARLVDICLAIEFAHTRAVIHRDLKPANLMLGDFGEAYVLDWGLARIAEERDAFRHVQPLSGDDLGHTAAGDLLGTPGYMSPEQARGEPVDWRTDIYALGCVLFEILVGRPALPRGTAGIAATLAASCHRPADHAPDIAPELDALCARATSETAAERPTARALADGIQAYLDGDRDVARRRELADEAVQAARAALAEGGDQARSTAMREAGRALALAADHRAAQDLLARLLLDVPTTIPAEALVAADLERGEVRRKALTKAAVTYLAALPALCVLFFLEVHHAWPLVLAMGTALVTAGVALGLARRPMPMASPWFLLLVTLNCLTIASTGLLFGPLFVMPMFLVGSLAAFLSQPTHHRPAAIVAIHLLPLVGLLALELTGMLPRSFTLTGHGVTLTPWAIEMTPLTAIIVFASTCLVQFGSSIDVQGGFRRAQEQAQNQIHAQTWHLKQLLPRASADTTGRVPKNLSPEG